MYRGFDAAGDHRRQGIEYGRHGSVDRVGADMALDREKRYVPARN
jgi:hypothetical protein